MYYRCRNDVLCFLGLIFYRKYLPGSIFNPTCTSINNSIFAHSITQIPGVRKSLEKTLSRPKSLCESEVLPEVIKKLPGKYMT